MMIMVYIVEWLARAMPWPSSLQYLQLIYADNLSYQGISTPTYKLRLVNSQLSRPRVDPGYMARSLN